MEIARISEDGRITIPETIRKKLHLKSGDKITFSEENGRVYLENSALEAFRQVQKDFAGAAAEAGFKNEQELQDYMLEIRKEVRGY